MLEVRIKNKEVLKKMLYITKIEVQSNVTYERYKKVAYKHIYLLKVYNIVEK